mmetsp:Transcript_47476/g.111732  ORF Transcript_47476/g.111732 Transcript_47476/m.111732 type:complete len:218 (+) Transcript_47476:350-1003(+)
MFPSKLQTVTPDLTTHSTELSGLKKTGAESCPTGRLRRRDRGVSNLRSTAYRFKFLFLSHAATVVPSGENAIVVMTSGNESAARKVWNESSPRFTMSFTFLSVAFEHANMSELGPQATGMRFFVLRVYPASLCSNFQSLTLQMSASTLFDPVARNSPSGENAVAETCPACPSVNVSTTLCWATLMMEQSALPPKPRASKVPSGENPMQANSVPSTLP